MSPNVVEMSTCGNGFSSSEAPVALTMAELSLETALSPPPDPPQPAPTAATQRGGAKHRRGGRGSRRFENPQLDLGHQGLHAHAILLHVRGDHVLLQRRQAGPLLDDHSHVLPPRRLSRDCRARIDRRAVLQTAFFRSDGWHDAAELAQKL